VPAPDPSAGPGSDLEQLRDHLRAFAAARNWGQYHTPKNLAMALAVEAAELMEPLQWLTSEEAAAGRIDAETRAALGDEIADVAIYLIRLADVLGVDLGRAVVEKIGRNEGRFPAGGLMPPPSGAGVLAEVRRDITRSTRSRLPSGTHVGA
jgi:NTP pyrophosphatase (non-canonical NTP hydrolase)